MRFILKMAILALIGLLILPGIVPDTVRLENAPVAKTDADGRSYDDRSSVVTVATGFAVDMAGLCARQPEVCANGSKLIDSMLVRAEHGLRVAFAMIEKRRAETEPAESAL